MFVNIPERPLERTVKIRGFTAHLYYKEQPRADPQQRTCSSPGAWREDIASLRVQTTSDAESAIRRVTSVVNQSVMPSPCGGHKAMWDNEETPRSPMPRNPQPPASGKPRPPMPRSPTPGNPRPSTRRPTTRLPAVTRTSGRIPCRRSTTCHQNSRVRKPLPGSYQ